MGIPSLIDKADVFIKKEFLHGLVKDLYEYFEYNNHQLAEDITVEGMFNEFYVNPIFDGDGNVISIEQICEYLYFIEDFLDIITPYVKSGSSVQIRHSGECGTHEYVIQKWCFVNGRVAVVTDFQDFDE